MSRRSECRHCGSLNKVGVPCRCLKKKETNEEPDQFMEAVYEIAFGEGAIKKGYCAREVLDKLREFSDQALRFEKLANKL